ncbi:glycosyltransferase family 4 protein [Alcanivorax sp.]|uniref:glycosyltransferase family 4 protein n=1 Tax=Alcanivorax sp. TaxID=1872427 RepID=UPI003A953FC6
MSKKKFLLMASFTNSLVKFRGPLIDALLVAGFDVHIAAPGLDASGDVSNELRKRGVILHSYPLQRTGLNPLKDMKSLWSLFRLMRIVRPDYVLGYTIKPVIYGSVAAWMTSVPHRFALITGLGYAFTGNAAGLRGKLRNVIQRLYRFALTRTERVFFQNPDDESLFRDLRLLADKVPSQVVNGSGVDVSEYQVVSLPDKPCFLLIARLLGDKGVREYAAAAMEVKTRYPDSRFLLVGWIDENPDAIDQEELDSWIESGCIEYLGKLADVRPAIADSSIYVLPSYREGTPRTVLEAMSMGRAVITTDAPGCRETVDAGVNGLLVPVKDVSALVAAMLELVKDPERIIRMGQASRDIAEKKYDVHKVNEMMLRGMGIL